MLYARAYARWDRSAVAGRLWFASGSANTVAWFHGGVRQAGKQRAHRCIYRRMHMVLAVLIAAASARSWRERRRRHGGALAGRKPVSVVPTFSWALFCLPFFYLPTNRACCIALPVLPHTRAPGSCISIFCAAAFVLCLSSAYRFFCPHRRFRDRTCAPRRPYLLTFYPHHWRCLPWLCARACIFNLSYKRRDVAAITSPACHWRWFGGAAAGSACVVVVRCPFHSICINVTRASSLNGERQQRLLLLSLLCGYVTTSAVRLYSSLRAVTLFRRLPRAHWRYWFAGVGSGAFRALLPARCFLCLLTLYKQHSTVARVAIAAYARRRRRFSTTLALLLLFAFTRSLVGSVVLARLTCCAAAAI